VANTTIWLYFQFQRLSKCPFAPLTLEVAAFSENLLFEVSGCFRGAGSRITPTRSLSDTPA